MNKRKSTASSESEFQHAIRFINMDSRNEPQSQRVEDYSNAISTTYALSNLPGFIALAEDNKNYNQSPNYYYMLSCAIESDGNMVKTFAAGVYIPGSTQGNGQGNGAFTHKALGNLILCPTNCKKTVSVNNQLAIP